MDVLTPHQTLAMAFDGWGELVVALAWWQLESVPANVGISSALLLSVGLFGSAILDRFFGGNEASGDSDSLMDDDSLDGGDGFDDFDDEMDGWDDPFGDDDDGEGESTDELDHRLSELEDEVARLSSTVNTVRSENTEISSTVDDIGENVRKLLDIYEMVTRGINPFVDDVQPGGGGGGGFDNGSLGLFDNSDEADDEDELDDSVTGADAEGFFDDDLLDDADDADDADDEFDDLDDLNGAFADEDVDEDDDMDVTEEMETEISNGGGKSFSELKDEYESGNAEWAEDDFGIDADAEAEADAEPVSEGDDGDSLFDDGFDDTAPPETGERLVETVDEPIAAHDSLEAEELDDDPATEPSLDSEPDERDESGFEFGNTTESATTTDDADGREETADAADAKPYLTALPDTYVGDLIVIEWMEYLVENADVADAARAVRYYERIDWVASDVARTLEAYLVGFGRVSIAEADRPGAMELSLSHHVQSLDYVQLLSGKPHSGMSHPADAVGRAVLPGFAEQDVGHAHQLRHDGGEDGL